MHTHNMAHRSKGIALLMALMVMVVLFLLGTAYLETMMSETLIARNINRSNKALYLAEAGLERSLRHLMDDPNTANLPWNVTEYLGEGSYAINIIYDTTQGLIVITSTGTAENASRLLQLKVDIPPWKYVLFGDTDIAGATASGTARGNVHANNTVARGTMTITGTTTQGALGQGLVLMPEVVMSFYEGIADQVYIGDMVISDNANAGIVYIKAGAGKTGKLIIDLTKLKGQGININNSTFIAEGGVEILGNNKRLKGFRQGNYPFLITKTGNIIDYRTNTSSGDFDVNGIIFSEKGTVHIDSIAQQGNILAKRIELVRSIDITYAPKYIPIPPPGFIGGIDILDWEEKGY